MIVLCIAGFIHLHSSLQKPSFNYSRGAFFKGFIDGYSTMDALAALAFGIVILTTIQQKGVKDRKQLTRYTLASSLVAGTALALVYVALGLIGARMASTGTYASGAEILTAASTLFLGQQGKWLLGLIFTLACFSSVVGLTSACGQYFSALFPKASYKGITLTAAVVGFLFSNLGLEQILKVSVPFLGMAYPLTIVLIVLTFFHRSFKGSKHVYRGAMFFTGISAIASGLKDFGIRLGTLSSALDMLPLSAYGLGWITPAIFGILIGASYRFIEAKLFPGKDNGINVS
jgi:LIVCS family branched-chain amino acid:cation transporter